MIDLYTFGTANGRKVSIMLEEVGQPYRVHVVDIGKGEQFHPEFVAINPNAKIPAIVDWDSPDGQPMMVFESGAILMYLAEKTGSPLLPTALRPRYTTIEWLMFQMSGIGPNLGQIHHFYNMAKIDVPYAKDRFHTEGRRIYGVLDRRLGEVEFLAGNEYTIADIATYPWITRHAAHRMELDDHLNLKRWFEALSQRPAVQKGMQVPA